MLWFILNVTISEDIFNMFLKQANSDTENGIKILKNVPENNHIQRKLKTGKDLSLFLAAEPPPPS